MRNRRLISLMLALALVLSLGIPAAAATPQPSAWATVYVDDANTAGLLTQSAAKDFQIALTRDEFCELVVNMIERTLGQELPAPSYSPFTDTSNIYILKAYQYGVVNGMGDNKFGPDLTVERQQLCTMMIRAIRKLESDMGRSFLAAGAATLSYKDASKISDYAVEPIKVAHANGIMIGDNNNNFNPTSNISSQECIAVIIRSFDNIEGIIAETKTLTQKLDMAEKRVNIGFAYGDTADGVTQDITLPTKSTGNATVTWYSSNPSVISTSGVVNVGTYAQSVTMTATIYLDGMTRTKTFTLTTSTLTGDALLLQNAYNDLDIVYTGENDGDGVVSSRIYLPAKALNFPVTWSSSNPTIVSTLGIVTVPSGATEYTATLTATIRHGTQTRTKTFNLRIVNPTNVGGVSLHNVRLGMNSTEVASALGAAKRTIQASSGETWLTYHTDYNNFVAVAFIGSKVAAVYSMATSVASQLKNTAGAVISVATADAVNGVGAISYSDGSQYAIMIYDTSSVINTSRTLYADGQEQLVFELTNAYRYRNSRSELVWTDVLGTPSRAHSVEMGTYNFLSATSATGNGTLQQRAVANGFTSANYIGGNVLGGAFDAVEFFSKLTENTTMRAEILSSNASVFGAGFSGGYTGTYKTYLTYMLGSSNWITAVTAYQNNVAVTTANVGIGTTASVTIYLTPSTSSETFTATSSNTAYMQVYTSVTSGTNGTSVTIYGIQAGTANLVIKGNSSGKSFNVPVAVGSTYASSLALSYGGYSLTNSASSVSSSYYLVMGVGTNLTITGTPNVSGAAVTWTRVTSGLTATGASVYANGTNGIVYAGSVPGVFTLNAQIQTSASSYVTHAVTVYVVSMSLSPGTQNISPGGSGSITATTASFPTVPTYTWSSDNTCATPSGSSTSCTVTASSTVSGTATITAKAAWSGLYIGTVSATATVVVPAAAQLTLSETSLELYVGEAWPVSVTTSPAPTVTWTSSNVAVDVANGLITALSPTVGAVTVTATISGTSTSKTVAVTVHAKPTIAITESSATIQVGETDKTTLTRTYPSLLPNCTVLWVSTDETKATINSSGTLTAVSAGTTNVKVQVWRNNEMISESTSITVTVTAST